MNFLDRVRSGGRPGGLLSAVRSHEDVGWRRNKGHLGEEGPLKCLGRAAWPKHAMRSLAIPSIQSVSVSVGSGKCGPILVRYEPPKIFRRKVGPG